jgi:hypothetical protein
LVCAVSWGSTLLDTFSPSGSLQTVVRGTASGSGAGQVPAGARERPGESRSNPLREGPLRGSAASARISRVRRAHQRRRKTPPSGRAAGTQDPPRSQIDVTMLPHGACSAPFPAACHASAPSAGPRDTRVTFGDARRPAAGLAPIRCHARAPLRHLPACARCSVTGSAKCSSSVSGCSPSECCRTRAELAASLHLAYSRGATLRALALASGMSHEQVRRIVQRRQSIGRAQQPSCHIV